MSAHLCISLPSEVYNVFSDLISIEKTDPNYWCPRTMEEVIDQREANTHDIATFFSSSLSICNPMKYFGEYNNAFYSFTTFKFGDYRYVIDGYFDQIKGIHGPFESDKEALQWIRDQTNTNFKFYRYNALTDIIDVKSLNLKGFIDVFLGDEVKLIYKYVIHRFNSFSALVYFDTTPSAADNFKQLHHCCDDAFVTNVMVTSDDMLKHVKDKLTSLGVRTIRVLHHITTVDGHQCLTNRNDIIAGDKSNEKEPVVHYNSSESHMTTTIKWIGIDPTTCWWSHKPIAELLLSIVCLV